MKKGPSIGIHAASYAPSGAPSASWSHFCPRSRSAAARSPAAGWAARTRTSRPAPPCRARAASPAGPIARRGASSRRGRARRPARSRRPSGASWRPLEEALPARAGHRVAQELGAFGTRGGRQGGHVVVAAEGAALLDVEDAHVVDARPRDREAARHPRVLTHVQPGGIAPAPAGEEGELVDAGRELHEVVPVLHLASPEDTEERLLGGAGHVDGLTRPHPAQPDAVERADTEESAVHLERAEDQRAPGQHRLGGPQRLERPDRIGQAEEAAARGERQGEEERAGHRGLPTRKSGERSTVIESSRPSGPKAARPPIPKAGLPPRSASQGTTPARPPKRTSPPAVASSQPNGAKPAPRPTARVAATGATTPEPSRFTSAKEATRSRLPALPSGDERPETISSRHPPTVASLSPEPQAQPPRRPARISSTPRLPLPS